MSICITGVTGNVGKYVLENVLKRNQGKIPIKASVRCNNSETKQLLSPLLNKYPEQQVELVELDFANPSTFSTALSGVKRIFVNRPPQLSQASVFVPFFDQCKESKVEQVTYLSIIGVEKQSFNPHFKLEALIKQSGLPYTFLRPSFFMQNLSGVNRPFIQKHDEILVPAGHGKTAFIDVRDIAEVAAMTLLEPEKYKNQAYELPGSEILDYNEVATMMTEIFHRPISYHNPSILRYLYHMYWKSEDKDTTFGFAMISAIIYLTVRFNQANRMTSDLEELLGRKPTSLQQFLQDYKELWSKEGKQ